MGNDSGIRQKNKQRTAPHKKHTVFPGMKLSKDVKVEYGSIKPLYPPKQGSSQGSTKPVTHPEPEWSEYDKAAKALFSFDNKSVARQRNTERLYGLAYRALVRAGLSPRIKRKYSKS